MRALKVAHLYRPVLRLLGFGVLTLGLSGCDWVGILAKEAAVSATSHRGWDSFTFKGQLPAEFGIDAIAFYGPNDPGNASCQAQSLEQGKTLTRWHGERYTAPIQAQPQEFGFGIPLSYYKGLCGMRLGRVKLQIRGRHGPLDWQRTYGLGGFNVARSRSDDTALFDEFGIFNRTGICNWWFQQSQARSRLGELEKILNCRVSIADLLHEDLRNKTVFFKVEVNPIEKPSMKNRWIETEQGWKPCQPTKKSDRCQAPPLFKTFKMNGQTCTVYPGCTE